MDAAKPLTGRANNGRVMGMGKLRLSADRLLTQLSTVDVAKRREYLSAFDVKCLRAAADLCGVESDGMTSRAAIDAILENF